MKKIRFIIMMVLFLSLVLTSCGTPTTAVPDPSTETINTEVVGLEETPAETTNSDEKELVVHLYEDMQNVDPAFYPSDADESIMADVYQGLVGWVPGTYDLQNLLAEEITTSEDGTRIEFKLREGVQFHHGYGEVTAEDVKYSYERMIDPELSAVYAGDWGSLDHVEVTSTYTGIIIMKEPFAPLWNTTLPGPSGYILSKKAVEEKGIDAIATDPVGTGPYEFAEWVPNSRVKMIRFADYWGDKPEWATIIHQYIPSESAVDIALETGEIDFGRIAPTSVSRFEDNPNFTVIPINSTDWEVLYMNVQHPLLKDVRVRQAIRYAIDIDSINEAVYEDRYAPLCNMMTPQMLGYWEDAPCYKQDLEKARELLGEAGVENLELHIAIQNTEAEKMVGEIIQANLLEIGINLIIDVQDDAAFVEEGFGPEAVKNRQLVFLNWINYPDPSLTTMFFKCDQTEQWNWSYYCNPEFDALNDQAVLEMDPEARADLYIEMQKLVDESAGSVFVSNIVLYYVARNDIKASITPHGRVLAWAFESLK